jgi:hypothetical protein
MLRHLLYLSFFKDKMSKAKKIRRMSNLTLKTKTYEKFIKIDLLKMKINRGY